MVEDAERAARSSECDAVDVMALIQDVEEWIERMLDRERSISPTILPPGVGILMAMDEVLEPETEAVAAYIRLLGRLEQIKGPLLKELSFRRLFDGWNTSLE